MRNQLIARTTFMAGALVVVAAVGGCVGQNPARPSRSGDVGAQLPSGVTSTTSASYTITGVVSERRGGPIADARVTARPNSPPGSGRTTTTDANGRYAFDGLSGIVLLDVAKAGYEPSGRSGILPKSQQVDFTLNRESWVAAGQALAATIWGDDELIGIEDDTGLDCDHPACKLITVQIGEPGRLTVRLTWDNPASELTVGISTGISQAVIVRGSSPIVASADLWRAGKGSVAVRFERHNGQPPRFDTGQPFVLETEFRRQ